jgi:hypothetical protein
MSSELGLQFDLKLVLSALVHLDLEYRVDHKVGQFFFLKVSKIKKNILAAQNTRTI